MQQHFLKKEKNSWPVLPSGSTSENSLPEPEDDIRGQSLIGGNDIIQKEAQVAFVSEERSAQLAQLLFKQTSILPLPLSDVLENHFSDSLPSNREKDGLAVLISGLYNFAQPTNA